MVGAGIPGSVSWAVPGRSQAVDAESTGPRGRASSHMVVGGMDGARRGQHNAFRQCRTRPLPPKNGFRCRACVVRRVKGDRCCVPAHPACLLPKLVGRPDPLAFRFLQMDANMYISLVWLGLDCHCDTLSGGPGGKWATSADHPPALCQCHNSLTPTAASCKLRMGRAPTLSHRLTDFPNPFRRK